MDQKGGQTIMVNLLFVIGAMDILYLIHKIPNLFINKPIAKFITKIAAGIILMHLLSKSLYNNYF